MYWEVLFFFLAETEFHRSVHLNCKVVTIYDIETSYLWTGHAWADNATG